MMSTSRRDIEILDSVVRLNIESGRPVSSGLVARFLRRAYSPATIRSVMKRQEEQGLLRQPYTSAGRVPTDLGFRSFVDRVLSSWPIVSAEAPRPLRRLVRHEIERSAGGQALVKVLASLLSRLTSNVSIILGPSLESVRALRVDLYPKEGGRVLIVLALENAMVRTGLVRLRHEYPGAVLDEAARILSERTAGRTVAEIRDGVLDSLDAGASPASRCAFDLASGGRELFAEAEEGEIELEGVGNILDEPEFTDPDRLKALVRFLESPHSIREALQRLNPVASDELGVWIGRENPIDELQSFSLVCQPWGVAGRRGVLAVLGPCRMPYQRAFSGLDILRRTLQMVS